MKSSSLFTLCLFVMMVAVACSDKEPMEIPISLDIPGKFTYISDNELHVLGKDQFLSTNSCITHLSVNLKLHAQWILGGTRVLYRSSGLCPNDGIHVLDPTSGQNQFLIGGSTDVVYDAASNLIGQRIAVMHLDRLAVYHYDGVSVQKIDSTAIWRGYLSLSPDGETVVIFQNYIFSNTGFLRIYHIGSGGFITPPGVDFSSPNSISWSNESDQFVVWEGDDIYLITDDGNEVRNLTGTSFADETSPAWSPVADEIVFVRTFRFDHPVELVLYDLKRGEGDVIFSHSDFVKIYGLKWSQDGSKLAFYNDAEFNGGIYVIDRNGSALTRYTNKGLIFDWIYP